ncbi:glycosyltransferase [Limnospira sp. PMC 1243.20]|uniref:glycosyltransferase n=1 Tax=Limnospira sp. PMC 1243.20 TaxID=2981041 RepID=UPI0028E180FC|nr:glycosyltransferase [Limnospira sp. PMC 1243.20]MDT9203196.1 glycosyltransferase [Limnospira sp. PMC 1243.20]
MQCKICDSATIPFGKTIVLNRYNVNYFQCQNCGFVQTENPYWLPEAYKHPIANSDDGLVFRNLMLAQLTSQIITKFFNPDNQFLDYGGGYGLLVRLMRDIRFKFDWYDSFCPNFLATGLEANLNPDNPYELITAFEVFEHFANPLDEINKILKLSKNILFSTELIPPHNPHPGQWWYYAPQEGQHIAIYTPQSLQIIAQNFGLNIYSNGSSLHLLTEKAIPPEEFTEIAQYNAAELRRLLWFSRSYSQTLANLETVAPSQKPEVITPELGVNVAGFVNGEFGIGEGVRATLRAMEAVNLNVAINNFTGSPHRKQDHSFDNFTSAHPYPINLIQINANDVLRFAQLVGADYFKNRYNIGFWAWELPEFPPEWVKAFSLFHEIWTYSDYCVSAIRRVSPIPVIKMMPTVSLPEVNLSRENLSIPPDKFIFLFMFDFYSRIARKNPLAVVEAFKTAFGNHPTNVVLILKCSNSDRFPKERNHLFQAIANCPAIQIIDGYLSREQINGLVYNCDCYISLHRSEGFGLTMAEAMFYGKPVIATGYSSNTEFMNLANSFLVKYRRVLIDQTDGPYRPGNVWAAPNIKQAAELMQYVVNYPEAAHQIGQQAATDIRTQLSPQTIGDRILSRLQIIHNATQNFTDIRSVPIMELSPETTTPPLVSICIPTYNGETFIREAILSALNQTYSNCEIILADDGSIDDTIAIAKSLQVSSPIPFRILTHINYGLVDNLNFCISQAQGKYVKFLFQDDTLEPNCIEQLVAMAEANPEIGLVFSRRHIILDDNSQTHPQCQAAYKGTQNLHQDWSNLKTIQPGSQLLSDPKCFRGRLNKIGEPTTVLIRRNVFSQLGGFDPDLHQLLDADMWFRIMADYQIAFVDKALSTLRIHRQQQTQLNIIAGENIRDYSRLYRKMIIDPDYRFLGLNIKEYIFYQLLSKSPQDYLNLAEELVNQYRHNPHHQPTQQHLRLLRKLTAMLWLKSEAASLQKLSDGVQGKVHKIILNSGIRELTLTPSESEFVESLKIRVSQGFSVQNCCQSWLAAMLYKPAYQLGINYHNAVIPNYLFEDFLKFIFSPSDHFDDEKDRGDYVNFTRGVWKYLKRHIDESPSQVSLWVYVAKIALELWDERPLMNLNQDISEILSDRHAVWVFYGRHHTP